MQFYGFMMVSYASDVMIGNYQAAVNFSVLLTFFTVPISTVLFPAFAKLDPKKEPELLKTVFASSIKYTSLLLIPATMAIMALSSPLVTTLFGERYTQTPFFLTLYVISNLFCILGSISLGSFLNGLGETKTTMKQSILTLSIGLPLGLLLIPHLNILGVILATILSGLPSMLWALHWTWKHYQAKADLTSSAKILAASTIAATATYASTSLLHSVAWITLTIGIAVFLAAYILTAPMVGAVTRTDIHNLRAMFSCMVLLSKLINIPLTIAERIAKSVFGSKKQL
jgi:O-antigen/teichoic acid export membrane protein